MTDKELHSYLRARSSEGCWCVYPYKESIFCNHTKIAGLAFRMKDDARRYLLVYEGLDEQRQEEVYQRLVKFLNEQYYQDVTR